MHALEQDRRWPWPLRVGVFLLMATLAMVFATTLDRSTYDIIYNRSGVPAWMYASARQLGEFYTWLFIAPLVLLADRWHSSKRTWLGSFERSMHVVWSPMFAGTLATLIKLAIRRERPDLHGGEYVFRTWGEHPWNSSDLGLPSGHATVAFGGAWMLAMMYPRLAPIWLTGAALCGFSRLMTRAHFLSDVVAGCILGFMVAWVLWTMYQKWAQGRDPVMVRSVRWMRRRWFTSPAKS